MQEKYRNTFVDFVHEISGGDRALCEAVIAPFLSLFEGNGSKSAVDALRNQVGENPYETDGAGVFNLSSEAGFVGGVSQDEQIDDAIEAGLESGDMDDFGTAIASEPIPTEGDFGFDDFSEGGSDFGLDLDGILPEDGLGEEDAGLDEDEAGAADPDAEVDADAEASFGDDLF